MCKFVQTFQTCHSASLRDVWDYIAAAAAEEAEAEAVLKTWTNKQTRIQKKTWY